jgi:anti-sigma factor RsiW
MLSTDSSYSCGSAESLRDYAFDELPAAERPAIEQHIRQCSECALELDRLQMTSAALRVIPDREIPQRIAFVSDKVFEPSWFARFWNSGARLGFASACLLAIALVVSAWHLAGPAQPAVQVPAVVQSASVSQAQIDAAVAKAVAQVRQEDAQMIQAAVQLSEKKTDQAYRSQIVAMQEGFDMLRKKLTYSYASLARNEEGLGQ